mgnify:CR=1 FL=1
MKKVIALVLALCMVFAMSAVAFAVEETITKGAADQEGTVVVRTVFDDDTPGAMTGTRAIPSSASEQFKIAFFFSSIIACPRKVS